MNRSSWLAAGAAAIAAAIIAGLGGCSVLNEVLDPSPSPSATAAATPTATTTPTEPEADRQRRLDKAAAEQAYLTVQKELDRLFQAGGADEPTKVLTNNAAGEYLNFQVKDLKSFKAEGQRTDRPTPVRVTANKGWSPKAIGLTACEDNSEVRILSRKGQEVLQNRDRKFVQDLTAEQVDGRWKIVKFQSKVVKTFKNESGCTT